MVISAVDALHLDLRDDRASPTFGIGDTLNGPKIHHVIAINH